MTHVGPRSAELSETGAGIDNGTVAVMDTVLWDRKIDGGFPETKELKNRVRNIIEPDRDLGHIDRSLKKQKNQEAEAQQQGDDQTTTLPEEPGAVEQSGKKEETKECEDCK
ncbi:hypothetical protein A1O1_05096 [Capronia coronata CBS 617.96]|uniref:Selenoprotein W-like protein n=1 Tax=Capronia coronata CBS 617.96 TaxID=1182541 RepID=W9Y6K7_9EURO|nr:uncharacterized protein A1O1_05096 [Capronia coronata CBS 617.96]EXJ88168.1 hypothetical protein A1O1_05096 [Capronia coronata CBS 617.96]